jgi:hypothetical protein
MASHAPVGRPADQVVLGVPVVAVVATAGLIELTLEIVTVSPVSRFRLTVDPATPTESTVPVTDLFAVLMPVTDFPISADADPICVCSVTDDIVDCRSVDDCSCPMLLIWFSRSESLAGDSGSWFCSCVTIRLRKSCGVSA